MVAKPPKKRATYQDVIDAPENLVAEILDGELHLFPRPRPRHARNATALGSFIVAAFDFALNGPGGWTILAEPELHLGPEFDRDVVVPDIAGWREGRLVETEDEAAFITVVPDWLCEVLSPSTARVDRMKKMPIYAREKITNVWLADPQERTIEVFRFERGRYVLLGTHGGDDPVRAEPFEEVEIPPTFVWGRRSAPSPDESAAKPAVKKPSKKRRS